MNNIAFITVLVFVLLVAVFATRMRTHAEPFDSIMAESPEQTFLDWENRHCQFAKQSGVNNNDFDVIRNYRLVTQPNDPTACYIKQDDSLIGGLCDKSNPNIYDPKYESIIEDIYTNQVIDPYVSKTLPQQACTVQFKESAEAAKVKDYVRFIDANDPAIKKLNAEVENWKGINALNTKRYEQRLAETTDTWTNKYNSLKSSDEALLKNQAASYDSKLNARQQECATSVAGLNTSITGLNGTIATLKSNVNTLNTDLKKCQDKTKPFAIKLHNVQTNRCLESQDAGTHDCAPNGYQNWTYNPLDQTIKSGDGKCLETGGDKTRNGYIGVYPCDGKTNKRWIVNWETLDAQNKTTLQNAATGQCLENGGSDTRNQVTRALNCIPSNDKMWLLDRI